MNNLQDPLSDLPDPLLEEYERRMGETNIDYTIAKERHWYDVPIDIAVGVKDFGKGVGKGVPNALADVIETATDATWMATGAYLGGVKSVTEGDFGSIRDNIIMGANQGLDISEGLERYYNYIRQDKTGNAATDAGMALSETLLKFGAAWKGLAGLYKDEVKGQVKKIATNAGRAGLAGAIEGATSSPDEDLLFAENTLRFVVEKFAPDSLQDFNDLMNPETKNHAAHNISKRLLGAIEIGIISSFGGAVVDSAVVGAKAGGNVAKEQFNKLPTELREPLIDAYGTALQRTRSAKEWLKGGNPGKLSDAVQTTSKKVEIDEIFDITDIQSIRNAIHFPENTIPISDGNSHLKALNVFTKYVEIAEKDIRERVFSEAKRLGYSEDFAAETLLRLFGKEFADYANVEGRKAAIAMTAHNELWKSEKNRLTRYVIGLDQGVIKDKNNILDKLIVSFHTVRAERDAALTASARVMKASQGAGDEPVRMARETRKKTRELADAAGVPESELLNNIRGNPEQMKILREETMEIIRQSEMFGLSAERVSESIMNSIRNKGVKTTVEFLEAMVDARRMGLLSSTITLTQNTVGSFAQGFTMSMDKMNLAIVQAVRGREKGDLTIGEAISNFDVLFTGHANMFYLGARALYASARHVESLPKTFGDETAGQLKFMNEGIAKTMLKRVKEDASAPESANIFFAAARGKPIGAIIQTQDMATKIVGAQMHGHGRFNTALLDDVFLTSRAQNKDEAVKVVQDMFFNGKNQMSVEDAMRAGFSKDDVMRVNLEMARFRSRVSKEAAEFGVDMALQTPMKGFAKKLGSVQEIPVLGKLVMPFFQTPMNIMNQTLLRAPVIPLGEEGGVGVPVHPKLWADFMKGGAARDLAISRTMTGNTLVMLGHKLAELNRIQHQSPEKDDIRNATQVLHIQPGGIIIGDRSFPTYALGPYGSFLTLGAGIFANRYQFNSYENQPDDAQLVFQDALLFRVATMAQILLDNPYMMAIGNVLSLVETKWDDPSAVKKMMDGLIGNVVGTSQPYSSLTRQANNALREYNTKAFGWWETALKNAGWLDNALAYNALSEPIPVPEGFFARSTPVVDDPTLWSMILGGFNTRAPRVDVYVSGKNGMPDTRVLLTASEWEEYNAIIRDDMNIRGALQLFVDSDTFAENIRTGNLDANKRVMDDMITATRNKAAIELIKRNPRIAQEAELLSKEKKRKDNVVKFLATGGK